MHELLLFPHFAFSEMETSHDDWNTLFSISAGDPLCQRVPLCLWTVKVPVRVSPSPLNLEPRTLNNQVKNFESNLHSFQLLARIDLHLVLAFVKMKEIMHHSRQNDTVRVMYWRIRLSIIPPFFCLESILELFARARLSLHLDFMASTTLGDFLFPHPKNEPEKM